MRHGLALRFGLCAAAVWTAYAAPVAADASAKRRAFDTVLQDDYLAFHQSDARVAAAMGRMRALGVDRVRLTAGWSVIAPDPTSSSRPDFDATDPDAYPRANWRHLDRAVRLGRAAGLDVMIDIAFWAPRWATVGDSSGEPRRYVNATAFKAFTAAVVKRYSGSFAAEADDGSPPPALGDWLGDRLNILLDALPASRGAVGPAGRTPLPKVRWWTIWNEPNHARFLLPQYRRQHGRLVPASPHVYRDMVTASYPVIKRLQPDSIVLVGGLSSQGAARPRSERSHMPPLRFLREMACVDRRLRPSRSGRCRGFSRFPGDGLAHHPYTRVTAPSYRDRKVRDNVRIRDLDRLTRLLDRLAQRGYVARGLQNVHLTEFGYETNPPKPSAPFGPRTQARFLSWSEYLAWRNPRVRSWAQFLLRDLPRPSWRTGLQFQDGRAKPALTGFASTLHAECTRPRHRPGRRRGVRRVRGRGTDRRDARRGARRILLFGRVRPGKGPTVAVIESHRRGRWRPARTARRRSTTRRAFATRPDGVFVRYVRHRRGVRYRLRAGSNTGLAVAPVGCR